MRIIHGNIKNKPLRLVYIKIQDNFYLVSHTIPKWETIAALCWSWNIVITDETEKARYNLKRHIIELERIGDTYYIDIYEKTKV